MKTSKGWRWLRLGERISPDDLVSVDGGKSMRNVSRCVGTRVQYRKSFIRKTEKRKSVSSDAKLKRHASLSHSRAVADLYAD